MDQLYFLEEQGRCRNLYCVGINEQTFSIYKYMKKKVAKLEHYYLLNDLESYRIAVIQNKKIVQAASLECEFQRVKDFAEFKLIYDRLEEAAPKKSLRFIERRYFAHPEYEYLIYSIEHAGKTAVIIGRVQECNGACVYRIMDMMGAEECFAAAGNRLRKLMEQEGYEYIDLYEYGMKEETLQAAGFVLVEEENGNIIPNYFEPFVQENIHINIFLPRNVEARMFKGDGDQDRPNFRKQKNDSII